MRINCIKKALGITAIAVAGVAMPVYAQQSKTKQDTFELQHKVPVTGTSDSVLLAHAPNPDITIAGEKKSAAFVVDLSQNVLYQYDEKGHAVEAFLVASGKKTSPSKKGIFAVTHVESYPYRFAPARAKRRRNPSAYGPKIICLETVNSVTGERGVTGQFIHGNNDAKSLGKYASLGCIRMDNEIIKKLATQVKRGHFVLIK